MSTRIFLLFPFLLISIMVCGQGWQFVLWQTTEGTLDSAEINLPRRPLTGDTYLKAKDKIFSGKPLNTQDVEWLVSGTDTIFVRRYYRAGTSSLYQRVVAGTYDLYRTVSRKGHSAWQLHGPKGLIDLDSEDYGAQMAALTNGDCKALEDKGNGVRTSYGVMLYAERLNECLGDAELEYSSLGEPFDWRVNLTVNTPLNLINRNVSLGSYWGLRVGVERPVRKVYNGLYLTGGIQPYYYNQDSDLSLGPLRGTYSQEWEMSAVQFNLGTKLELWPTRKFAPFGEIGAGMVLPIHHRRYAKLQNGEPQSPGFPIESSLEGGMRTSFGVYWSYGVRMKYRNDWLLAFQITRDGMFVDINYGDLSSGSRSLFFNQDNALLIGEWRRWELLLQKQF